MYRADGLIFDENGLIVATIESKSHTMSNKSKRPPNGTTLWSRYGVQIKTQGCVANLPVYVVSWTPYESAIYSHVPNTDYFKESSPFPP